ncbi:uncharacterized protein LOC124445829 isoform X2 [Xenia sp. Carnegie-2017]|uniref:uncharacterized protein LOC124445829 isoform X2 n=1 Tax=Xenia sp. Carnegie-2017 TaxID=2897299 RepID=UPI001F033DF0|nr:uncharacterized protein LOC124445829 isoform X2 [Xenia sp. Carnegie-2017]
MGRTAKSWAKINLFFLIYYICLASFFAAMFAIAYSTWPDIKDGPKYNSILYNKPLLLVFPDGRSPWKQSEINNIRKSYDDFLRGYNDTKCYLKDPCKPDDTYRPENAERQCGFDYNSLGPCSPRSNSNYGYDDQRPCLYLRLSKIYKWSPKPKSGNFVEISCEPHKDIKCYPDCKKAFPISFWPFRGESHFRTPIVAIQLFNHSEAVTVKCKAVAQNIELSDTYKHRKGATGKIEFRVVSKSILYNKPQLLVFPDGRSPWKQSEINNIRKSYDDFLYGYNDTQSYLKDPCKPGDTYRPENAKRQCGFDFTSLGPCSPRSNSNYGYDDKRPCLYLRLSKIYKWSPKPKTGNFVEISCEPHKDIKCYPDCKKAFPISFWPFRGESHFRTPIVAIQLFNHSEEVTVKCKAVAQNIELSDTYKLRKGAIGKIEFRVVSKPSS